MRNYFTPPPFFNNTLKNLILIVTIAFLLIGCEEDNNPSEGYPVIYYLFFEPLQSDGTMYNDDEVLISGELELFNGQLHTVGNGELFWFNLGKLPVEEQNYAFTLFGVSCTNCDDDSYSRFVFASGAEGVDVNGSVPFEKDKYWLLRYASQDVDTLRIHDVQTTNPYHRTFSFFINEQEIEATNFIYHDYAITIQK